MGNPYPLITVIRRLSTGKRAVSLALHLLFVGVILAFWARTLYQVWPHLVSYPWQFRWPYLFASLLMLLLQMLTLATAWWYALSLVGAPLPWQTGASMWLRAQLARYLPGGMWDIAGRLVISRELDMPSRAVPAAAGLEIGLQVLSATLVIILTLVTFPSASTRPYLVVAVAALPLLVAALAPPVFYRVTNLGLHLLGRPSLPFKMTLGHQSKLLALYIAAHACQGSAFVLFVHGVGGGVGYQGPLLAGAYVAAWLVGYMAVFAPAGVGVREAALVLLTQGTMPTSVVVGAALGFRVWLSVRDLLAALVGILLQVGRT